MEPEGRLASFQLSIPFPRETITCSIGGTKVLRRATAEWLFDRFRSTDHVLSPTQTHSPASERGLERAPVGSMRRFDMRLAICAIVLVYNLGISAHAQQ
jgi:hypothetical protein